MDQVPKSCRPGSSLPRVGLLDYYRQFEDIDEEELNRARRARWQREKQLALEKVPDLDLSGTEWPEFPNSEVVNASIFTARGRVNGYPDRYARGVRRALAERHSVEPERIVLGNGASELLQTAAFALLSDGDELVMPWPSYPLYPLMASRAGARPVPVDVGPSGAELGRVADAAAANTKAVVICNPNDPTGTYVPAESIARLLSELPDSTTVLLDEALIQFQDVESEDAALRMTADDPRLVVFRTFSKVYGLSGLRAGYAVTTNSDLLDAIAPVMGVNALTQSAVDQALKIGGPEVERRKQAVVRERRRILHSLKKLPVETTDTRANFVWLRAHDLTGLELANRLREQGVIVAPGGPLGSDDYVRAQLLNHGATDRLLQALKRATESS
jgi:histidinol-phosphate aminotransferase